MPANHPTNYWLLASLILLVLIVFILDLLLPLGVAVGVLYVMPVFVSLWLPGHRYTIIAALVGTALALVGFVVGPPGIVWIGLFNRGLTLGLIWATAVVVLLRKRAEDHIKTLEGLIPICAACKKIRNDQGFWDILELYIQQHSAAQFTHGMCPEYAEHYYGTMIAKRVQ